MGSGTSVWSACQEANECAIEVGLDKVQFDVHAFMFWSLDPQYSGRHTAYIRLFCSKGRCDTLVRCLFSRRWSVLSCFLFLFYTPWWGSVLGHSCNRLDLMKCTIF